jgi:hypothetical protein
VMIYETSAVGGAQRPVDQVASGYLVVDSSRNDDEVLATASVGCRRFDDALDGARVRVMGRAYRTSRRTGRVRQDQPIEDTLASASSVVIGCSR